MKKICFLFLVSFYSSLTFAAEYILPPEGIDVIGELKLVQAKEDETLLDIARQYGVGNNEIIKANPTVDQWYPGEGTPIVIPTRYVLPNAPRKGLVMNLPEMRIYYYPETKAGEVPKVYTFPVGIGRMDWQTPRGLTKITEKRKNPTWTPPASIKREHAAKGDPLPNVVPAGPDNPLGSRALRLGIPGYLIHGTNKPYGVGMRVSHGCVRMRQEDVELLFDIIPHGTQVNIINQPLKVGYFGDALFMEFHSPLEEDGLTPMQNYQNALDAVHKQLDQSHVSVKSDLIEAIVTEESGLPVQVNYQSIN